MSSDVDVHNVVTQRVETWLCPFCGLHGQRTSKMPRYSSLDNHISTVHPELAEP